MRLVIRSQTSECKNCSHTVKERKRKPCPHCGHMNRHITRHAIEALGQADRA